MNEKRTDIPDEQFQKWNAYERAEINDVFDPLFKGLNYLFVAHGAGLFGAITLIKDGKGAPFLQGIALFFHLFSFGLIFAILSFVFLVIGRLKFFIQKPVLNVLFSFKSRSIVYIGTVCSLISTITLILVLFLVSVKVASLQ